MVHFYVSSGSLILAESVLRTLRYTRKITMFEVNPYDRSSSSTQEKRDFDIPRPVDFFRNNNLKYLFIAAFKFKPSRNDDPRRDSFKTASNSKSLFVLFVLFVVVVFFFY